MPAVPTPNARLVRERRYPARDEQGRVVETAEDMFRRVARAIAEGDRRHGGVTNAIAVAPPKTEAERLREEIVATLEWRTPVAAKRVGVTVFEDGTVSSRSPDRPRPLPMGAEPFTARLPPGYAAGNPGGLGSVVAGGSAHATGSPRVHARKPEREQAILAPHR